MRFNNVFLMPAIIPLIIVAISRSVIFVCGLNYTQSVAEGLAVASLVFGIPAGVLLSLVLYDENANLGGFTIGKRSVSEES